MSLSDLEIEMGVDSGAAETVVGPDMLTGIDTLAGDQKKQGVEYEVATGERRCVMSISRCLASGR